MYCPSGRAMGAMNRTGRQEATAEAGGRRRSVLLVGTPELAVLERQLQNLGHRTRVITDEDPYLTYAPGQRCDIVVVELGARPRALTESVTHARQACPGSVVCALSTYDSVATLTNVFTAGFDAFVRAPASADDIIRAATAAREPGGEPSADPSDDGGAAAHHAVAVPCSPARARWEYMSRIVQESSSLADAARRLGVDKRSLRRMLNKHPPRR